MPLCKSKSENGTEVEEKVRDGDEEETGGEVGTQLSHQHKWRKC